MPSGPATRLLETHTPALFAAAVREAAFALAAGEVVALPTETVYGLAANALNAAAVAQIFTLKGRPSHNPVIVHAADLEMARACVADWPEAATRLATSFWPGPLTLVLPKANSIPEIVTAGGETVGIRWPSHPLIQAVIRACGFPLAAPSANRSNRLSPTTAAHVRQDLGERVRLIIDGGRCEIGIESTVVDLTHRPLRVLRPGMIHTEVLQAVLGEAVEAASPGPKPGGGIARSPGRLPQHYAPRAKVLLLRWRDEADLRQQILAAGANPACTWVLAYRCLPVGHGMVGVSVMPHDAAGFARSLYAELHRGDGAGAGWIAVERPPTTSDWHGIHDRLTRAAA